MKFDAQAVLFLARMDSLGRQNIGVRAPPLGSLCSTSYRSKLSVLSRKSVTAYSVNMACAPSVIQFSTGSSPPATVFSFSGTPPARDTTSAFVVSLGATMLRKKRIRFSAAWDVLFLKTVISIDAHLTRNRGTQKRLEEVPLFSFPLLLREDCGTSACRPGWH